MRHGNEEDIQHEHKTVFAGTCWCEWEDKKTDRRNNTRTQKHTDTRTTNVCGHIYLKTQVLEFLSICARVVGTKDRECAEEDN